MYNRYHFRYTQPRQKHSFKLPTKFTAPLPDNSNLQEYMSNILYDLKTGLHRFHTIHIQKLNTRGTTFHPNTQK